MKTKKNTIKNAKKIATKMHELILAARHPNLYKSWKLRMQKVGMVDYENKVAFYEVHGAVKAYKMNNGQIGMFKLLNYLPFQEQDEPYEEPESAHWEFLGYIHQKPIIRMSFPEFVKMTQLDKTR